MSKRLRIILSVALLAGALCSLGGTGVPGSHYTIVDIDGHELLITGWRVYVGDGFICPSDREYEVIRVRGRTATARYLRTLPPVELPRFQQDAPELPAPRQPIIIYHTHNHESYVPTDGTDSIRGRGGIFKVGNAMAEELENQGLQVEHLTDRHDPADSRAYNRSRRTAVRAIRDLEPVTILDVHRDAAPRTAYQARVDGERVAQVMIVVGRYNPNRRVNTRFARRVMAAVEERAPGLMRGIFFARGSYNQDLSPRSLLLEIGSHLSPREDAEAGARMFAQAATDVLHPGLDIDTATEEEQATEEQEEIERASQLSALSILTIVAIGGTAFTVINQPGLRPKVERVASRGQRRVARALRHVEQETRPARQRIERATRPIRQRVGTRYHDIRGSVEAGFRTVELRSRPIRQRLERTTRPIRRHVSTRYHDIRGNVQAGFRSAELRSRPIRRHLGTRYHQIRGHVETGFRSAELRSRPARKRARTSAVRLSRRVGWRLRRRR